MTGLERIKRWSGWSDSITSRYPPISVPKKSHIHTYNLYSHRRCRFRSFRAPMRTALSGSCSPIEVAVLLSPTVIRCGSFCHRRSVYLDVVARESCGRRNSFVPHYFFSSFLRVERARNCSLDSLAALAMDCGTVAQCVGVTPGPLCIAGIYACSVRLSWYRCSLLSFSLVLSFSLLKERDGNRWKNLFVLNSLLNECTMGVRFPVRQRRSVGLREDFLYTLEISPFNLLCFRHSFLRLPKRPSAQVRICSVACPRTSIKEIDVFM